MISGAVDALKNKAKEVIDQKKTEAMDKVNAEKVRLQGEADKAKADAEAKARAEADKAKKDAEDQLKNSAKDKLKGIFGK
jgi:F0F1-type ATP synthase membrane subunit b/b'